MNQNGHTMNDYRANNVASTSSNSFIDFLPQNSNLFDELSPNQHQNMTHRLPHNQWQEHAMQMNAQQMNPQPSNQISQPQLPLALPNNVSQQQVMAFNQTSWPNQIQNNQQFSGGINPMTAFNLPAFFPQHIMQEAFSMSSPVEAEDEPMLLNRLLAYARRRESYKDALNSLHGKNGHSASLWKDYYLDNKDRLDSWIVMCLKKEQETKRINSTSSDIDRVKSSLPAMNKPSPSYRPSPISFKAEQSPVASSSSRPSNAIRPLKKAKTVTPPLTIDSSQSGSRRNTINSLTAPSPVYGGRLSAPNAEIKIPDPPSRSPSPPTNIIPHRGRGHKYTTEDREFFIKFIGWRLKQDPTLTRLDICNLLAEKAPHHTAQSWASHWSNNHDVPDKILAAARGEDYQSDGSEGDRRLSIRRKPKYKDSSTTDDSDDLSGSDDNPDSDDDGSDDDKPIRHYPEKEMGAKGSPFTSADLYVTAKYIADIPDWEETSSKDRWEPYSVKFPQRSAKSWAEYYRRNERAIGKLVKKLRRGIVAIDSQCAKPSRKPLKRKYDSDMDNERLDW